MNTTINPAVKANNEDLQAEAMISEGGGVSPPPLQHSPSEEDEEQAPDSGPRRVHVARMAEGVQASKQRARNAIYSVKNRVHHSLATTAENIGKRNIERLSKVGEAGWGELQRVPGRMHRVANQTKLVLELLEDFRSGVYRDIPWRTIAVLAGAALYAVSPADVVPDVIPVLGQLDDLAVVTIATRWARADLKAYCQFKGYPLDEYFAD